MPRLYLDHNVGVGVADALVAHGHEAFTARAVGLHAAPDPYQLLAAVDRQAILVSHDANDFLNLHRAWQSWSRRWGVSEEHHGILLPLARPTVDEVLRQLLDFLGSGVPYYNRLYRAFPRAGWVEQGND